MCVTHTQSPNFGKQKKAQVPPSPAQKNIQGPLIFFLSMCTLSHRFLVEGGEQSSSPWLWWALWESAQNNPSPGKERRESVRWPLFIPPFSPLIPGIRHVCTLLYHISTNRGYGLSYNHLLLIQNYQYQNQFYCFFLPLLLFLYFHWKSLHWGKTCGSWISSEFNFLRGWLATLSHRDHQDRLHTFWYSSAEGNLSFWILVM